MKARGEPHQTAEEHNMTISVGAKPDKLQESLQECIATIILHTVDRVNFTVKTISRLRPTTNTQCNDDQISVCVHPHLPRYPSDQRLLLTATVLQLAGSPNT